MSVIPARGSFWHVIAQMIKEYSLATQSGQIAIVEYGNPAGVPVLCLHGWLDNSASFAPLGNSIRQLRLICLDLAGHGHSYHRTYPHGYPTWDDTFDVLDIADALALDTFHILAHSRGAMIASLLAATTDRVEKLALLDGFFFVASEDSDAAALMKKYIHRRRRPTRSNRAYASLEQMVELRLSSHLTISYDAAKLLVSRGVAKTEAGYIWRSDVALRDASAIHFNDAKIRSFVEEIACDVKFWTPQIFESAKPYVDLLLSNNPKASIEMWQGGHHFHMETNVPKLAKSIERFILC